ncbi:hypothetical protein LINPERPRIM_LOCUS6149 [Linum perenne]
MTFTFRRQGGPLSLTRKHPSRRSLRGFASRDCPFTTSIIWRLHALGITSGKPSELTLLQQKVRELDMQGFVLKLMCRSRFSENI